MAGGRDLKGITVSIGGDRARNERPVFGVMREEDMEALHSCEGGEPRCLWLMIPGMNSSADSADAILTWITIRAVRFFFEASVICNVAGCETAQNYFFLVKSDGLVGIIQNNYASRR